MKQSGFEIERKFLIEYPNSARLKSEFDCLISEIVQTYLESESGDEVRVRSLQTGDEILYYHTVKRRVSDIKRVETERRISIDEYTGLLTAADKTKLPIRKTRYSFEYKGHCFEVDIYPFWNDRAIVEVELDGENEEIIFPEVIKVIKEVTGDKMYKNSSLAALQHSSVNERTEN